jgi:thiosulfate dehydrogenase (quinone) large subunit
MKLGRTQLFWLVALRVLIGWHFLYEGLVKLVNPNWSSLGYLLDSGGPLRELFVWMASTPSLLQVVDFMNVWGLILVGLGLMAGLFERAALAGGIVLLAFYYFSHPPFIGLNYGLPSEGSYLVVNKTLIELVALIVLLVFPTAKRIGLDRLIYPTKRRKHGRIKI